MNRLACGFSTLLYGLLLAVPPAAPAADSCALELYVLEIDLDKAEAAKVDVPLELKAVGADVAPQPKLVEAMLQSGFGRLLGSPTITTLAGRRATFAVDGASISLSPTAKEKGRIQLDYEAKIGTRGFTSTRELDVEKWTSVGDVDATWREDGKLRRTKTVLLLRAK